jgi:hypothetical protein
MKFTTPIVKGLLDVHNCTTIKCNLAVIKSFEVEEIQQDRADCKVKIIIFSNKYIRERKQLLILSKISHNLENIAIAVTGQNLRIIQV